MYEERKEGTEKQVAEVGALNVAKYGPKKKHSEPFLSSEVAENKKRTKDRSNEVPKQLASLLGNS